MRHVAGALPGFVAGARGPGRATGLEPVSFLGGTLTGKGPHPLGSQEETLNGAWSLRYPVTLENRPVSLRNTSSRLPPSPTSRGVTPRSSSARSSAAVTPSMSRPSAERSSETV